MNKELNTVIKSNSNIRTPVNKVT